MNAYKKPTAILFNICTASFNSFFDDFQWNFSFLARCVRVQECDTTLNSCLKRRIHFFFILFHFFNFLATIHHTVYCIFLFCCCFRHSFVLSWYFLPHVLLYLSRLSITHVHQVENIPHKWKRFSPSCCFLKNFWDFPFTSSFLFSFLLLASFFIPRTTKPC